MNLEELNSVVVNEKAARERVPHHIRVCTGTACEALTSQKIAKALEVEIKRQGLAGQAQVKCVGCPDLCSLGPLVEIETQAAKR